MALLLLALPYLLLVILANVITATRPQWRVAFNLTLFIGNVVLLLGGLALRFFPAALPTDTGLLASLFISPEALGTTLIVMGGWGAVMCMTPVREALRRIWPVLDPESAVHTLALISLGLLVGNALLTADTTNLDALSDLSAAPTLVDVLVQQMLFTLVAFLGVGLLTRRDGEALNDRLGLERPTRSQLWTGVRWMAFFVFLQAIIGATWMAFSPAEAEALNSVNQALLGNFDTVWEWLVLAMAAGVGEETLFRGALQPIFGIIPTSIIFAVSHGQYGLTPATLTVFLLSLVLGVIRKRSNTTVAIFVHAGYNFILGLLALLATALAPLVGG